MKKEEFRNWMLKRKRMYNGKMDYYTETAVKSRISCLERLENHFNIDLDSKVTDKSIAEQFLQDIRDAKIENITRTPLSNAFRHYFEFATGLHIDRRF